MTVLIIFIVIFTLIIVPEIYLLLGVGIVAMFYMILEFILKLFGKSFENKD